MLTMHVRPDRAMDGAPVDPNKPARSMQSPSYWGRLRALTLLLLLVWAAVTLAVPWYARDLNHWRFAGMPLGLWMSSQGAIGIYLLLIVTYALCCDRMERAIEPPTGGAERTPPHD